MRRAIALIGLMILVAAGAFAFGGGGFFQGTHVPLSEYSNSEVMGQVSGGFGYGVDRGGSRYGGFGMVIEEIGDEEFLGGFGGLISGRQFRTGPVTVSLNLWSGVGYVAPGLVEIPGQVGFLLEANAEAGVKLLPWMQVALYGGMQAIGGFDPHRIFTDSIYTPVAGIRFTWGSF